MEENRAFAFQGGGCAFVPRLLEAGVYTGAAVPDEEKLVWRAGRPKADYFLFHCIGGALKIVCRQKEYTLQAGSVLLLGGKQAVEVAAQGETRFTAFRFRCQKGKPPIRAGQVYKRPVGRLEESFYTALFAAKERADPLSVRRLSLYFALLTYEWLDAPEKNERKSAAASVYEADIRKAVAYLQTHLEEKIQMSELARELHLSERNFRKYFTEEMGVSPKAYLQTARLQRAKELLRTPGQSISEISESVGYYSQFQFSRDFKKEFGLTPSAYRGGAEISRTEKAINQKTK